MCLQKEELLRSYTDALNILLGHLRLQADAILARDSNYDRFDDAISAAEVRKQEGAEAYKEHVARHGCGCAFNLALDVDRNRAKGVHMPSPREEASHSRPPLIARVGTSGIIALPKNGA